VALPARRFPLRPGKTFFFSFDDPWADEGSAYIQVVPSQPFTSRLLRLWQVELHDADAALVFADALL
jgi:hypothetical protein